MPVLTVSLQSHGLHRPPEKPRSRARPLPVQSAISSVSTTIATPASDEQCAYCQSAIFDHDPICVRKCTADCGEPMYFCNYACLSAHIDEEELTSGNACQWSPD